MKLKPQTNALLKDYTTLHLGGVADYLMSVSNEEELSAALEFAKRETDTRPLILGGGSNVVCSDQGYRGLVIINDISGYTASPGTGSEVLLAVGAGENFDQVIEQTIADGLWGLENLSAIPGSVGATPIQNVGAYGVEIADVIHEVSAINIETLEKRTFSNADCQFKYRDSFFKTATGRQWCVTNVVYRLSIAAQPVLTYRDLASLKTKNSLTQSEIRDHVVRVRSRKFPDWHTVGTAGSFFKNPIIDTTAFAELQREYPDLPGFTVDGNKTKVSLGWILDKVCNLRGHKVGHVRLYEEQALVLVAEEGATAAAVEEFAQSVAAEVKEKTGIDIEREVLSV